MLISDWNSDVCSSDLSDSLPLTAANLCNRAPHRAPRRQCLSPAMVMDFDQGALPEPRLVGRQFLFAAAGRGDEAQGFRAWLAPPPSCRRARRPGGFWPEKRSPGAIFPMPAM